MKRLVFLPIILALLLAPIAHAQIMPFPVAGKVVALGNANNLEVTILNHNTGESVVTHTNEAGEFLIDWANTNQKYNSREANRFEISVLSKTQFVDLTPGAGAKIVIFDFTEEVKDCPAEIVCPPHPTCPSCPNAPDPDPALICTESICRGVIGETPSDENYIWAWVLIAGLLGGTGIGAVATRNRIWGMSKRTGLRRTVDANGVVRIQHRHPGIRGYHDPNTLHREKHERHPRGELDPEYEYNEKRRRYEYVR